MAVEHWDHDAERALIGCALLDASTLELVSVSPRAFTGGLNRVAWQTMLAMRDEGTPIDPLTIADCTQAPDKVKADLPTHLTAILAETITAANAEHYGGIITRHYLTRQILETTAHLEDHAAKGVEGGDLLSSALSRFSELDQGQYQTSEGIGNLVRERYQELSRIQEAAVSGEPVITGFTSGVKVLDTILGGIQPGIATIVCGRPGHAKTALVMGIADANSQQGIGCHVFSLEDVRASYTDRALSRHSDVPAERLRGGEPLSAGEMGAVRDAANKLHKRRHWLVDDRSGLSVREVIRSVRRHRRENETRIVAVDYIQLLKRTRGYTVHESITENINLLADAAKRDSIAYIVASQLSRRLEQREKHERVPRLSDLRESGSLEERAKAVIALFRPAAYDKHANKHLIELHVIKHSQGRTGYADARWDGPTTRIY